MVTSVKLNIKYGNLPVFWTQDHQQHSFADQAASSEQLHFPVNTT